MLGLRQVEVGTGLGGWPDGSGATGQSEAGGGGGCGGELGLLCTGWVPHKKHRV